MACSVTLESWKVTLDSWKALEMEETRGNFEEKREIYYSEDAGLGKDPESGNNLSTWGPGPTPVESEQSGALAGEPREGRGSLPFPTTPLSAPRCAAPL